MKKLNLYAVAGLLFISLAASGGGVSHAWFYDRDADETESQMATVDIELAGQSCTDGMVSFTIGNNSNIDIYLRAGLIFEAKAPDGGWALADMRDIKVEPVGAGWKAVRKTFTEDDGSEYGKWFLAYAGTAGYSPISSDVTLLDGAFHVRGAPEGYELVVHITPEAVQVDTEDQALDYLQQSGHVRPSW